MPSPVRQAERVCVQDSVTALTAMTRVSFVSVAASAAESPRKTNPTAVPARKYSPTAQGMLAASVTKRARSTFLRASPPSAPAAETAGTLAAAIP